MTDREGLAKRLLAWRNTRPTSASRTVSRVGRKMTLIVLDLETEAIEPRPKYPPEPVGLALRERGDYGSVYMAFGHPVENNCTRKQVVEVLHDLWDRRDVQFIFHNAAFDLSVIYERFGLPPLPWHRVHDTMFLLFLYDPHAKSLGLKEASEALLGWPSEERNELHDWIWDHRKELVAQYGGSISRAKSGPNSPAAWIAKAPGKLVGKYARGDVRRTEALFDFLYPKIKQAGMEEAYDRERRLQPIFMENERVGLRVDLSYLRLETDAYREQLRDAEKLLRHYLGVREMNFDNDNEIADVFLKNDIIHPDRWVRTKKSQQLSVSKENLTKDAFVDPLFADVFGYRNRLKTCLTMFMESWLEQASANNGYIFTNWNQVRNNRGGTRTGRPSMTKPNLLNVAKSFEDRKDEYTHPEGLGLTPLPLVRRYILPDEGHVWLHRDFSGQELRVFAHFESGDLQAAYLEDAELDPHDWVRQEILALTGKDFDRTSVKVANFQSIYGGGIPAIMHALMVSNRGAREFKTFHDKALPGRKLLVEEIQKIVRRGEPIRTWGGRLYRVEPPSFNKKFGRITNYEYKLINYLVQGSSADLTKESINEWHYGGGTSNGARFLLTVYDEINVSALRSSRAEEMAYLKYVMERPRLDIPMLSDGKWGPAWGRLEKCK